MPTDDPFARPDVRALCEAVAAGDDPAAWLVLADRLAELGADREAADLRTYPYVKVSRGGGVEPRFWWVSVAGITTPVFRGGPPGGVPWSYRNLAYALALAADRLAARAAAK
jgi:hypothetical protein